MLGDLVSAYTKRRARKRNWQAIPYEEWADDPIIRAYNWYFDLKWEYRRFRNDLWWGGPRE